MKDFESCDFCCRYWDARHVLNFRNRNRKDGEPKLYEDYSVAFVVRTYRKGHKRQCPRSTDYRSGGLGYKLNFCPECGRRLP